MLIVMGIQEQWSGKKMVRSYFVVFLFDFYIQSFDCLKYHECDAVNSNYSYDFFHKDNFSENNLFSEQYVEDFKSNTVPVNGSDPSDAGYYQCAVGNHTASTRVFIEGKDKKCTSITLVFTKVEL